MYDAPTRWNSETGTPATVDGGEAGAAAREYDVIAAADPEPCIIVRAAPGMSVVLPAVGRVIVPQIEGNLRARFYPWPLTGLPTSTGAHVDQEHLDGHLFHLDFCDTPDHVR